MLTPAPFAALSVTHAGEGEGERGAGLLCYVKWQPSYGQC